MKIRWRSYYLHKLKELNPSLHYQEIAMIIRTEFILESQLCLMVGILKGVASLRIAKTMGSTKSFEQNGIYRVHSTAMMIFNIFRYGCKSRQGFELIKRINHTHAKYKIPNADFLYLLGLNVCDFIDWNEKYSWRRLTETERTAWLYNWQQIGIFMGIAGLPSSIAEFRIFTNQYERMNCAYSDTNAQLAMHVRDSILNQFSFLIRPIIRFVLPTLLDENTLKCFGWPSVHPLRQRLSLFLIHTRAFIMRHSPVLISADGPPEYKNVSNSTEPMQHAEV